MIASIDDKQEKTPGQKIWFLLDRHHGLHVSPSPPKTLVSPGGHVNVCFSSAHTSSFIYILHQKFIYFCYTSNMEYNNQALIRDICCNVSSLILLFFVYKVWGPQGLIFGCTVYVVTLVISTLFLIYAYMNGFRGQQQSVED
jgi:hypothetical protein